MARRRNSAAPTLSARLGQLRRDVLVRGGGVALAIIGVFSLISLLTFSISDPTWNNATGAATQNFGGALGATLADILLQLFGGGAFALIAPLILWGCVATWRGGDGVPAATTPMNAWMRGALTILALPLTAALCASAPAPVTWPFVSGAGGIVGDALFFLTRDLLSFMGAAAARIIVGVSFFAMAAVSFSIACGLTWARLGEAGDTLIAIYQTASEWIEENVAPFFRAGEAEDEGHLDVSEAKFEELEAIAEDEAFDEAEDKPSSQRKIIRKTAKTKAGRREAREQQPNLAIFQSGTYELPPLKLLAKPPAQTKQIVSDQALDQNARMLESVLADFGVRGEIINVRPGPVVTLYELEPAAGVKSSRVVGLSDDIARSMAAVAARVAVIPGRNAIGIELPNQDRETVYIRELISTDDFENSRGDLTIALGKSIGGEPMFADLARMPHLLIAGTTGSGKSVGVNSMILSLIYRLSPDQCKMIMIDPKMLELSVYDGIPHLLSPVVTDPKKAVVALKWTVREMEERYRRMSKLGVRNIEGFNQRINDADEAGECLERKVHTGYDSDTGEPIYETEELDYEPMPFIVVVIDEVADLMMVAGKDIEAMVQRLAQMARAAGIHLIMATQRPSVDVITGTIKANFPTRISFQVTSRIDSRTILGEQGAEQLLGNGDMLHMAGGGRIRRVHGAFVSDDEVEKVVAFLKKQGKPDYIQEVTELQDEGGDMFDDGMIGGNTSSGDALYDKAVAVVLRDRKASTSYIQRRLQIGYNRAATLIERMEDEGVVSSANHAGKRDILVGENAA